MNYQNKKLKNQNREAIRQHPSPMKYLSRVDLHIVYLLLPAVLVALCVSSIHFVLLAVAVLPQGMILTHANDMRKSGHPDIARYVFANELFVILVVASCWAGWSLLHRT